MEVFCRKSNKDDKGAIIGGAVGGGLAIIAINVLVCLCFIRRRRRTRYDSHVDLLQGSAEPLNSGLVPQLYQREAHGAPDTNTVFSNGRLSYDPYQSIEASTSPSFSQTGLDPAAVSPLYGIQRYNSHKYVQIDRTAFPQHSGMPKSGGFTSGGPSPTPTSSLVPSQSHPVNVLYHDNAGPVNEKSAIPKLLPAYSGNIRNTLPRQ